MLNRELVGKIIQCHLDCNAPETFVVGYLLYVDKEWFIMQDISPIGKWNGIVLYLQSDVVAFEDNTRYIDKMKVLLERRNEKEQSIPIIEENALQWILNYGKDEQRIVGLELHKSGYRDVNGFIMSTNNAMIKIKQIDEYGSFDGESFIAQDSITRCFIGDDESICLEILHESMSVCRI